MKSTNKTLNFKIFLGCALLVMLAANILPRIAANGSGGVFGTEKKKNDQGVIMTMEGNRIETYVIEGAGHFLKGYSDILLFLNGVEMSDLNGADFDELRQIAENASVNMKNAAATYEILIRNAETTPYRPSVLSKLNRFDYQTFGTTHHLNGEVFNATAAYLKNGDVRGIYKTIHTNFTELSAQLDGIRQDLSENRLPELSGLWQLQENASKTLLFGQYVARVFYALPY